MGSGAAKDSAFWRRAHLLWPNAELKYPLAHAPYRICQLVRELSNEVINAQQKPVAFGAGDNLVPRWRNSRFSWVILMKKEDVPLCTIKTDGFIHIYIADRPQAVKHNMLGIRTQVRQIYYFT